MPIIKKNLIILYPSFERGGVEENIKNLINNFSGRIKVHLISSLSSKKSKLFFNKKINLYNVKSSYFLNFLPSRVNLAISSISILIKLIKKLKNQKLIIHSMQSNIVPIIICMIFNLKIVIRNSEDPIYSVVYSENKIRSIFNLILKLLFYNFASCIITNSFGSKNSLSYFVFNANKIKTIYNPYLKKINYKNYPKKNYIINIARFRKQKNHILLIRAFYYFSKYYDNYKLMLIGDGILKKKIKNEVKVLGLDNKVLFKGWADNTVKYIKSSKLFVLSSLYEGLGNVLIDAINYNVPCISTKCKSGPEEILLNGRGGYLVKNNNINSLYKKMVYSITNYELSLKKNNFCKKTLKRFDLKKNVRSYEKTLINYEN